MPTREEAIEALVANGFAAIAEHVQGWRNAGGGTGGWDANVKSTPAPKS